jgi:hypothetical protein
VQASSEALDDEAQVKDATLEIIRQMVEDDLVQVGDLTTGGFVLWNLGHDRTLERIRQRWDDLPGSPGLGDVCWFANTAAGDETARRWNESADT